MNNIHTRFYEIDFLKGISTILMIVFHFFYLSKFMNVKDYNIKLGILPIVASISHYTFILLSGMNFTISTHNKTQSEIYKKKIKQGLFLIAIGFIISYLSYLEFGDSYVKFGILHFLGVSMIISSVLIKQPLIMGIVSIILIATPIILKQFNYFGLYNVCNSNPMLCFTTGIMNVKYKSLDHFPLIPWLGFFFVGCLSTRLFYKLNDQTKDIDPYLEKWDLQQQNKKPIERRFKELGIINKHKCNPFVKIVTWFGQRSLSIYILHFIILWALFNIIKHYNII